MTQEILKVHPAAELFPMMDDEQFKGSLEDIRENGLEEWGMLSADGMILDGRNRYKACQQLGIHMDWSQLEPSCGVDPYQYVISKNLHRRHLTYNQRVKIAAKMATLKHGDVASQKSDTPIGVSSIDEAAKALDVSPRAVKRGKTVLEHGSDELGYESAADMIRNGYELDPQQIELAVAWLKINEPDAAIGISDVSKKVREARANPIPKHGEIGNGRKDESRHDDIRSTPQYGTGTEYLLRRLKRESPELFEEVCDGKLSANAAAKQHHQGGLPMLVLSRKENQSIVIDGKYEVHVCQIRGDKVRIGITAPPDVPVHRREVQDEIDRAKGSDHPAFRAAVVATLVDGKLSK